MTTPINYQRKNFPFIKQQITYQCKKFEKYFLSNPKIECKIFYIREGFYIKITLISGNKYFHGIARGPQLEICINDAINRLSKMIKNDKNIFLRRNGSAPINNFNLFLFPTDATINPEIFKIEPTISQTCFAV
ncbi:MAG: hypothetical protein HQK49_02210 [Oligoflexia bacterium]|nr:hypothetical protein [Oligoflexia bacterium]